MINSVSVRDFQKRLSEEMCMYPNDNIVLERRFRPNIVVESRNEESAYVEDLWNGYLQVREKEFGSSNSVDKEQVSLKRPSFYVKGPCTRCRMINIEPDSGVEDKAYLRVLSKYRRKGAG